MRHPVTSRTDRWVEDREVADAVSSAIAPASESDPGVPVGFDAPLDDATLTTTDPGTV